jgi:hypothetical protein
MVISRFLRCTSLINHLLSASRTHIVDQDLLSSTKFCPQKEILQRKLLGEGARRVCGNIDEGKGW